MAKSTWKSQRITPEDEALSSVFPDYEVAEHKILQFTDIDGGTFGNNKWFSCELHGSSNGKYRVYTSYGKVGQVGAFEIRGPGTEQEMRDLFNSIIKEKTTRKSEAYKDVKFIKAKVGSPKARLIVRKVDAGEVPQEKKAQAKTAPTKTGTTLDPKVAQFIESIFRDSQQAISHFIDVKITADGFETPLGVLSYAQISDGRGALKELGKAIKKKDESDIRKLSSQYYTTIPHRLGFDLTGAVLDNDADLQRELDILQLMHDSLEVGAASFTDTASAKYYELGIDLVLMADGGDEYGRIEKFVNSTVGQHHESFAKSCRVENIFKLIVPHERDRFGKCPVLTNEQELFHGSRNSNVVGILKRGLLIAPPEAPVSGWAFGKGNYFADKSSKSLQYSLKPFGNYSSKSDKCYLFLNKVRLGKQYELTWGQSDAAEKCKRAGCDSTLGKASSSGLRYNEFITYELHQSTLTYIVEIKKPNSSFFV
jgi:poly [ADP-ribose] polymerase